MARIHLIAIGGSVMHNLALALADNGHLVSGSDDQIFDPARTKLAAKGLLPIEEGWFPAKIDASLDYIILGMHAKRDNPELEAALHLGIPVFSFPEFVQKSYKDKFQIVVIGSHGKTTTTSMIMHIFKELGLDFDYLVGSQLEGFTNMVRISDAPYAIIEGDEYLSSCLDASPKFMHYRPDILVITGIAWDHYNVFPTFELYLNAFRKRLTACDPNTKIVYCKSDPTLESILKTTSSNGTRIAYEAAPHKIENSETSIVYENESYPLQIFGNHNLENLSAAITVCSILDLNSKEVFQAITTFRGASKRLERIYQDKNKTIYRDFAHAPSKLKASLSAVKAKHPSSKILAVVELHTYSSLNPDFLPHYAHTADDASHLILYFDQKALEIKGMSGINAEYIKNVFNHPNISVITVADELRTHLEKSIPGFEIIIFAGSGHFGNLDLSQFYQSL